MTAMTQKWTGPIVGDMIFDWSNFATFIPWIAGGDSEPETVSHNAYGSYQNFRFDTDILEGRFEFFEFARPMRAIVLDADWRQTRTLHIRDGDWIRFNFSLSIDMKMAFGDGQSVNLVSPSWRVINNPPNVDVAETITAGAKTVWVTICCLPEFLTSISGASLENMPELLRTAATPATQSFHEDFDFTERLGRITADIIRSDLAGPMRIAYTEARALELLCLAVNEIMNPRTAPAHIKLSAKDEAAIRKARELLQTHFVEPPTIDRLSRQVGVNRNKLYYGFRLLYDSTISEFVQHLRLEEGKRLMEETDAPLAEIARKVGFSHQCNFSTAFKKRFGATPTRIRSQARADA